MLIILEGPDCAGKTTFARRLEAELRVLQPDDTVTYMHKGPPTAHALEEYAQPLLYYWPGTGHHIICDRWHLGEIVYPLVFNRSTTYTRPVWVFMEHFLQSQGAYTLVLAPPLSVLHKRLEQRGDDTVSTMQMIAAWDHYRMMHLLDVDADVVQTAPSVVDVLHVARGREQAAKERKEHRWQPSSQHSTVSGSTPRS